MLSHTQHLTKNTSEDTPLHLPNNIQLILLLQQLLGQVQLCLL